MTEPLLTKRFDDALRYAAATHRDQTRKGTAIPYISHLMAVASLVLEHGGDEDTAIAALLHDAVEDQGGEARMDDVKARFGPRVAEIVAACTDAWTDPKPPWKDRKVEYVAHVRAAPLEVRLVSMADKLHNGALVSDYRDVGEDLWSRFNGGRDGTLWYYRALADAFGDGGPSPLLEEFQRNVAELLALADEGATGPGSSNPS
jgi:(p)ppGpp synthase/HD superfamily hydrolase